MGTSTTVAGLPAKYLDPDDPEWHDDAADLSVHRTVGIEVPPEIAAAVCRLGRWKRMIAAAEQFAATQGWIVRSGDGKLAMPDHRRMAAEGVPLMQYRKERLRLVEASMWCP